METTVDHGETTDHGEAVETPPPASTGEGFRDRPLREFRAEHSEDYLEPMARTHRIEPFSDPDRLAAQINPDYGDRSHAYQVNCADVARSFERSWRGDFEEAAGRTPEIAPEGGLEPAGEDSRLTEEWAGEQFRATPDPEGLRAQLLEGGHGSSAIVHSSWESDGAGYPGGHAYNLVNDHGVIRVVDAQIGETSDWRPGDIHPYLGQDPQHVAMAWDGKGTRIW